MSSAQPDTSGVSAWKRARTFESGVYPSLARWIARRPDLGDGQAIPLAYVGLVRSTMWLWIWASAVEMAVVHLIVPWPWVRWPLLIVSVWGLVWMLGYLGSLVSHPHLVDGHHLRVRSGHTVEVPVALDDITHVASVQRSFERSRVVQADPADDMRLCITVSSQVNVQVRVIKPVTVELPGGRYTFTSIAFWADDPTSAIREIRTACERTT